MGSAIISISARGWEGKLLVLEDERETISARRWGGRLVLGDGEGDC